MAQDLRHLCFELFDELEKIQQLRELLQVAMDCANDSNKDRVISRFMLLVSEFESSADCCFDDIEALRVKILRCTSGLEHV